MQNKDTAIQQLHEAILKKFGSNAFRSTGSEKLGSNHILLSSASEGKRFEFSIVAEHYGLTEHRYSIQVETDSGTPQFDIPMVQERLTREAVLEVINQFHPRA